MGPSRAARLRAGVVSPLKRCWRFWGRHRAWGATVTIIVILLAGATVDLLRIRADLDSGRKAISGLQLDNLDAGLVPTITKAADRLHHADHIADTSPFLATLNLVPFLHDQVHGVRDLTHVADHLGQTGVGSAQAIDKVLKQAGGDASKRVTLLDTVLHQLDVVQGVISKVHIGAHGRLIAPLASARAKVVSELDRAPARLAQARFYVSGLRRLLSGPSNYLLLAGNNAEMRGGAGMPLSGGVVTITDGDINFGAFKQLSELRFGSPPVTYPASWDSTYRRWSLGRSYLETAVSPNFAVTGPMYQEMSDAAGFGHVDGVLEVDAVALRNLLQVIGPVKYAGKTYDAKNVEQQVLNENYLTFATIAGDRTNRVELQGELAKAIFQAFKERNVPIAKLAFALREAAFGRHLLAHSTDPAVESLWKSIGADGSLYPTGLMVAAENVAANKLDWYLRPDVTLNVLPSIDGSWKARLTVSITNPVLTRTSPQVDGTYDHLTNGTHRTMLAVYLPREAYDIQSLDMPFSEAGPDPPLQMAAKRYEIPRGTTKLVAMSFSLPKEFFGALILPSGRAHPMHYLVNGRSFTDAVPTPVFWVQPSTPGNGPGAPGVAGVLALAGALAVLIGGRARIRLATVRPMRAVPDLVLRAPSLGVVLFIAALGVLVAGALISGAT